MSDLNSRMGIPKMRFLSEEEVKQMEESGEMRRTSRMDVAIFRKDGNHLEPDWRDVVRDFTEVE